MPINIKNQEAERLLREIKAATGRGTSEIVLALLRQEARRVDRRRAVALRRAQILDLVKAHAVQLPRDLLTADEIIGYDDDGLPT
jgi:antitoxin VapB